MPRNVNKMKVEGRKDQRMSRFVMVMVMVMMLDGRRDCIKGMLKIKR